MSQASQRTPCSSRTITTLRLTPQLRNRLANASFLTAFLFSIFTVSHLSGQSPGRLPCPARPNGTGQRAEADQIDGQEIQYAQAIPRPEQARTLPAKEAMQQRQQSADLQPQQPAQEPRFNSFSARLAYQVSKWRQASG